MYEKSVTEDLFQILASEYDLKQLFLYFFFFKAVVELEMMSSTGKVSF